MNTDLDIESIHKSLIKHSAVAVPFLTFGELRPILGAIPKLNYTQRKTTASGVIQNFESCGDLAAFPVFQNVAKRTEAFLQPLAAHFHWPIHFNDLVVHRYNPKPHDEFGISPHRDHSTCVNVIAVFLIEGESQFFICEDRHAKNAKLIRATIGDMILMRGHMYAGILDRPFHCVGKLTRRRITFGMRQTHDGKPLNVA